MGDVLKPDIAAPGVNILAQGLILWPPARRSTWAGECPQALRWLLRMWLARRLAAGQIHPDWSNAYIKSALMSTSKYLDVWNYDRFARPAAGYGRWAAGSAHAADPGINPGPSQPELWVHTDWYSHQLESNLTSVARERELLIKRNRGWGDLSHYGYHHHYPGSAFRPQVCRSTPGATASFTVTFDTLTGADRRQPGLYCAGWLVPLCPPADLGSRHVRTHRERCADHPE